MTCGCPSDTSLTLNLKGSADYKATIQLLGLDLTGATALMQIRRTVASQTVLATLSTGDGSLTIVPTLTPTVYTTITINISKTKVELIGADAVADIQITKADTSVINPLDLTLVYHKAVTRS